MEQEQNGFSVDDHGPAGETGEQQDEDGSLQNHPHPQEVPSAEGLENRVRWCSISVSDQTLGVLGLWPTWENRVSHADAIPMPTDTPIVLTI